MTLTILGIIAALVPFVLWLARRRIEEQTPEKTHLEELQKIDTLIAAKDETKINISLDDSLRELDAIRLRDARKNHTSGQGSDKHES